MHRFVLTLLLASTTALAQGPTFDPARITTDVKTLSSDAYEGRGPATPGETKTVAYIVAQMQAAGLQPGGTADASGKRGWTQDVPLLRSEITGTPTLSLAIAGGLGAYVRRLSHDLPVRLGAAVHAIDWSGQDVRIESSAGTLRAKAVIVTTPMAVLQQDAIRFAPALPNDVAQAIHGFTQGVYEHVVLHWPDSPFRGADRLAFGRPDVAPRRRHRHRLQPLYQAADAFRRLRFDPAGVD